MVRIEGGNGSCHENAIIIKDCNNIEGVNRQYDEIRKRFGRYKLLKQALIKIDNKMYDRFTLDCNGEVKTIFFDITEFFGKY